MKSQRTHWIALGTLLCLFSGAIADAQENNTPPQNPARGARRDRNYHLSNVSITYLRDVLKLDKDQVTKIREIHEQLKKDLAPSPTTIPPTPADPNKVKELTQKADDAIQALLKEDQKALVKQALQDADTMRAVGLQAVLVPVLKITDAQKKQIAQLGENLQKEVRALPREERRTKGMELRKKAREEAINLLTDEQKKALEQYEKEHPRPQAPPSPKGN